MRLTDVQCRTAKPAEKVRKLSDGQGLQLWIQPTGSRQWNLAYRFQGRQKLMAIGPYPAVTLAKAREATLEAKKHLATGEDPMTVKREKAIQAAAEATTFATVAREYLRKMEREGRAPQTIKKVGWLLDLAIADIGSRKLRDLKPADVLVPMKRLEERGKFESARRMRSTVGSVFRYAIASGKAESDPTAALAGALITPKVKSRAAVTDPQKLGGLLRSIDTYDGNLSVRSALQLMPLLFPRPGELRMAEKAEFNLEERLWRIPAERMKMRRPHQVPLSSQAVEVLRTQFAFAVGTDLVFPGVRNIQRPVSDNAMNAALRYMGYSKEQVTAHGFRATASTLLNESGKWSYDAIERQLAHQDKDEIRRAYSRGEYWEERVRMMTWWADYLESLKSSE